MNSDTVITLSLLHTPGIGELSVLTHLTKRGRERRKGGGGREGEEGREGGRERKRGREGGREGG